MVVDCLGVSEVLRASLYMLEEYWRLNWVPKVLRESKKVPKDSRGFLNTSSNQNNSASKPPSPREVRKL